MQQDLTMEASFRESRIPVGEVTLHVVEAGEPTAPLVVLLHGFPEFWYSWRHQLPALANAGFHAVAPDLRGYNTSDRPERVSEYRIGRLTADVAGLIRAFGKERAIVVGHDWGAIIAWQFAQDYAAVVEKLVILNVPHPVMLARGLRTFRQAKKSWYIFFFQLPWVPEWWLRRRDYQNLRRLFAADWLPERNIERYVDAARHGAALRGGIDYYRAAFRDVVLGRAPRPKRIDAPTLVIWGVLDRFLGEELAAPSARWVPNARVERLPNATHWVQQASPERVNELLLEFIGAPLPGRVGG